MNKALPVLILVLIPMEGAAARPKFKGKTVLFGNLHAHSKLSDDVKASDNDLPAKAWTYAQSEGLDFLAISDHHKAVDTSHRLFMTADEYENHVVEAAKLHNQQNPGKLIAIPAIEWGETKTGNHVNVFGAPSLPPDSIRDEDYDELIRWARDNAAFVQLNHPNGWKEKGSKRNKDVGNFGGALFANDDAFRQAFDPTAKTITIISSVWGGHIGGKHAESKAKTHRDVRRQNYDQFLSWLNRGFHLSPAANQDTHRDNWGTVTAARTAVWADSPTYDGLIAGIQANRIYATEDDELVVAFQVRYNGGRHWMGSTVGLLEEEAEIELLIRIWQASGADGDSRSEGPYSVTVHSDYDGIGGREAAAWTTYEGLQAGRVHVRPLQVVAGEYIFLEISEENGKDNPIGDGDDQYDNTSGDLMADGKRDDLNDQAWTSPVWFALSPAAGDKTYVWSKNSKIFHDAWCWAVKNIGSANRREGPAPADRTKHDCPAPQ